MARALIAATDFGVEEAEIVEPINSLKKAGIEVTVASNSGEAIQTVTGDKDWASKIDADSTLADVKADDYDLLVIPGGTVNADTLRVDEDARRLVKEFSSAGKPLGAICHGPWVLIDAGVAAIVQPGGSVRDELTVEACRAAGVTMYFTGTRHFYH